MIATAETKRYNPNQPEADVYETIIGALESASPSLKAFLSWEDEFQNVGPFIPELC